MRFDARQRGLSTAAVVWIVVGVIALLGVSVVVAVTRVVVPEIKEQAGIVKSQNNVRTLATFIMMRAQNRGWKMYAYSGKNLILSTIASGDIDIRDQQNLATLFSPGDVNFNLGMVDLDRYGDVTREALRAKEDFHELTSYAGRRMGERVYWNTTTSAEGVMLICDDDEGPLHQSDGLVAAYTNTAARFLTWEELGITRPADPDEPVPFLGESGETNELRAMSAD